jgi:hypothetical protein
MSVSCPRTNASAQPFVSVFRHGIVTVALFLSKKAAAFFSIALHSVAYQFHELFLRLEQFFRSGLESF